MPMAGPALRFERMHQTLFAGQTSIELYGSNPKKTGEANIYVYVLPQKFRCDGET